MVTPNPHSLATLAFTGVIATQHRRKPPYDVAIAGLSQEVLHLLKARYFPNASFELEAQTAEQMNMTRSGEFNDLLTLLLKSATEDTEETRWVAHAVATASMSGSHLWEDMGLPDRSVLSDLMTTYFYPLASRNTSDMKWKKFFYRALCEQVRTHIPSAPDCSTCGEHTQCAPTGEAVSNIFLVRSQKK